VDKPEATKVSITIKSQPASFSVGNDIQFFNSAILKNIKHICVKTQ